MIFFIVNPLDTLSILALKVIQRFSRENYFVKVAKMVLSSIMNCQIQNAFYKKINQVAEHRSEFRLFSDRMVQNYEKEYTLEQ